MDATRVNPLVGSKAKTENEYQGQPHARQENDLGHIVFFTL